MTYQWHDGAIRRTDEVVRRIVVVSDLDAAALDHAIECYRGPNDDTVPVLRGLVARMRDALDKDVRE